MAVVGCVAGGGCAVYDGFDGVVGRALGDVMVVVGDVVGQANRGAMEVHGHETTLDNSQIHNIHRSVVFLLVIT